jgi:hypothetical protein
VHSVGPPAATTTTLVTPADKVVLVQHLTADLAKASAIATFADAYAQAKADALGPTQADTSTPATPPPPLVADADMYRAATVELVASRAKDSAQSDFDAARQRLSEMATALYIHAEAATPQNPTDGAGINRAGLLAILLSHEQDLYSTAKHGLDDANHSLSAAKAASNQLVAARAAAIDARAAWSATTTTTAAPTTTAVPPEPATTATTSPSTPPTGPKHAPRAATKTASKPVHSRSTPNPILLGADPSPTILGPMVLTADELAGWFASTGHTARLTVPLPQLAGFYGGVGAADNVRADIAFAQAILETGYFYFPAGGQLTPADNNFAGLGACDSCAHGWSFPDAQTGVAAQLQLLHQYATREAIAGPLPGLVSVAGCCQTWMALSGVWATGPGYGYHILSIYQKMLDWALARRATATGL